MSLTLLTIVHPEAARAQKISVAAAFAEVDLPLKLINYGVDNETADYARHCHPCYRLPVLQTEEGAIFESNSIMRHIARCQKNGTSVYGNSPYEQSQVDMWLDFAATEIDPRTQPFLRELFFGTPTAGAEALLPPLEESLTGLELWLETRTYLVGERMTIADISVAFALQWAYRASIEHGEALTKKFKNVYRLYNTVMQQPKTVEVLKQWGGTFGPAKAPKKAEEKKPKAEKKPKEAEQAEEAEEEKPAKEEKKANPLDALPASSFVLDAFKREYSNTDTRTVAAPYFFANYDAEGYTCYWCRYKYNEENKMQFMTANLVRGWFQRMEHVRKYAFGIALIIGEDKKHDLVGMWVFRGKGMPEIVSEVVDTELFDWEEIADVQAAKDKITDYLCWEGPTIPLPVLEGRCFK